MIDEGYTKFDLDWTRSGPLPNPEIEALNGWRPSLYAAKLLGHYEDLGIGYGNISIRVGPGTQFAITGTQTGHLDALGNEHYALVTGFDIEENRIACTGPLPASSESMTHAAIYALDASVNAIVHVHDRRLWQEQKGRLPTTDAAVAYGTPEMAREFSRLLCNTEFRDAGVAVMGGHEEGLISVGRDIDSAAGRILALQRNR